MLNKLTDWILGKEPLLSAEVGLAGGFAALYAVLDAFDVLHLEPAQVAAIGALVAWAAAFLARRAVTPVTTPGQRKMERALRTPPPPPMPPTDTVADDSRIEDGGVPLATIIFLAVIAVIMIGILATCDALFDDAEEEGDLGQGRIELVSHEYDERDRCYDGYDCGGGDGDSGDDWNNDQNNHNRRNRGAFSPGPFDRSPVDFSNSCISLDCSGRDEGRPEEREQP